MESSLHQKLNQLHEFLSKYTKIPQDQWNQFKLIFKEKTLEKDEFFTMAGSKQYEIGFICKGFLRLYYLTEDGNEFNKTFLKENNIVASYSSLLLKRPSTLNIQALEATELLVTDFTRFHQFYDKHICWQELGRKIAEYLFIKKEQKESDFLLLSAEARYLRFLEEYPSLEKRISQYHIASYIGITPIALSRIRKKLKNN